MPSSKRSRTPPTAPATAHAAPAPAPPVARVPGVRETFERRHFLAAALIVLASVPVLLAAFWNGASQNKVVVVVAVIGLAAGAWIFDQEQWAFEFRRQVILTLGAVALAAATAPAVPLGLIIPTFVATILAFKRGWGSASALVLGAGVAYAIFGISPVKSYPYVLGMAWPAVGANVMRRIALAGSGHGPATVLGRGRW